MDWPLDADPRTAARVRDALARQALGGRWAATGYAREAERDLALHLRRLYPGLGNMILAGLAYHREVIRRAVTGGEDGFRVTPAAGVIITGQPLPPPGLPLHSRGAVASPRARFVYTAPGPWLADVAARETAPHEAGRVSVVLARSLDPDAVLRAPASAELLARGPVSVHVVLVPARWPPGLAAAAVARYAELVPAGSTLCMSLVTGHPGAGGAMLMEDAALAGGRAYHHSAADVLKWVEGAGLAPHPDGVTPVRAIRQDWAAGYPLAPGTPGETVGILAVKPPARG